jgi:ribosomal protein S27E
VLYAVVEEHAEAFFARLGEQGASLPAFVHEEFARYLRRGRLEEGFVRVVCTGCRHEHLVALSCKCRGFCPSCGARRMVESAAGLVEHVCPHVPVRQWVLSFPWPTIVISKRARRSTSLATSRTADIPLPMTSRRCM